MRSSSSSQCLLARPSLPSCLLPYRSIASRRCWRRGRNWWPLLAAKHLSVCHWWIGLLTCRGPVRGARAVSGHSSTSHWLSGCCTNWGACASGAVCYPLSSTQRASPQARVSTCDNPWRRPNARRATTLATARRNACALPCHLALSGWAQAMSVGLQCTRQQLEEALPLRAAVGPSG